MKQKKMYFYNLIRFVGLFIVLYFFEIGVRNTNDFTAFYLLSSISPSLNLTMIFFYYYYIAKMRNELSSETFKSKKNKMALCTFFFIWITNTSFQIFAAFILNNKIKYLSLTLFGLGWAISTMLFVTILSENFILGKSNKK
jgi:hypothetical protein